MEDELITNINVEDPVDMGVGELVPEINPESVPSEGVVEGYSVGEFMGTIQESVQIIWTYHLKTKYYTTHVILNEFYTAALEVVDSIIETYQGISGQDVENYYNTIVSVGKTEYDYLIELKGFVVSVKDSLFIGMSELLSEIDSYLSLIDKTIYKLRINGCEPVIKSFESFCYENYKSDSCCKDGKCDGDCDDDRPDFDSYYYDEEEE